MPTCSKCKLEKDSSFFGDKDARCKPCLAARARQYYYDNTETRKAKHKEWYLKNKAVEQEKDRKRYIKNKKHKLAYNKIYSNTRRKEDISYKLAAYLRSRLLKVLKRDQKVGSAVKDLGCSAIELKEHLESLWQPNMTWDNYGCKEGQWSIDHIIPLSKVDLTNRDQFLEVNHYTNLQPMWHMDNIKKSNKVA